MLQGDSFGIFFELSARVAVVKEKIYSLRGIAPDLQRLLLGQTLLDDSRPLIEYGVQTGSILTMLVVCRPRALLEVEVWTERGLYFLRGHSSCWVPACRYTFFATVTRACVANVMDPSANGVYCTTSRYDTLAHGSHLGESALRGLDVCTDHPAGWYITRTQGAKEQRGIWRVEIEATVRGSDDPAMDGTYRVAADGRLQNGSCVLAWYETVGCNDETCPPGGWYVMDLHREDQALDEPNCSDLVCKEPHDLPNPCDDVDM